MKKTAEMLYIHKSINFHAGRRATVLMHRRTSLENTQIIRKCLSLVNILMRINLAKAWKVDHSLSRCLRI